MPQPLPRWLFVLIGLIIIIVVGCVVFFATNIMNLAASNTTATPHNALVTAPAQANGTALPTPKAATSNKTVFLIMMENHNWSDIKNNPSAPFINNTLLPMASYQLAFRVI